MKIKIIQLRVLWHVVIAACLFGCHGFTRTMPAYPQSGDAPSSADEPRYLRAIDGFYRARSMKEAEAALDEAVKIAPDAPKTNEIAGHLDLIRGDEALAWRHFYLALASSSNPDAFLHMQNLLETPMTALQYRETKVLFEELLNKHPDEELKRVIAAYIASWQRRLDGDFSSAEKTLELRGAPEYLALISAFDNNDGHGFATEYPPEREIDYSKEYTGTQLPARWRMGAALGHQRNLDLGALVSPGTDVVAYVSTYIKVPEEGEYSIRLSTTDAIKLWVNQIQVLAEQEVDGDAVDQFVVPVTLRSGFNSILIKTCNGQDEWVLGISITDKDGALIPGMKSSLGPETINDGPPPGEMYKVENEIIARLKHVKEPARKSYYAVRLAKRSGVVSANEDMTELYLTVAPSSFLARLEAALSAWESGRLGATIDYFDSLIDENEGEAPYLYYLRAAFFDGQSRQEKMRNDLKEALKINSEYRSARDYLADSFQSTGWREDNLKARLADVERWPDDTEARLGLAAAYKRLGRSREAEALYKEIHKHWKGASDVIGELVGLALKRNDHSAAIKYQKELIELYPTKPGYQLKLGDILRSAGRFGEAVEAYESSAAIDEQWYAPLERLGDLAYERDDMKSAVDYWRRSLEVNPDNHFLSDRLEYAAPTDDSLLQEFVPSSNTIKEVLSGRARVDLHPASDLVMLLDHSVEQIGADGSSRQVVTQIMLAANDTGRDRLTNPPLPRGRLKIKEVYAVDPDGTRREASSVRGENVRFRDLKVGATVVIQYQLDTYPGGYLSRHLHRRWFFHEPLSQFEDSHYVLLAPKEMKINEYGHGEYQKTERTKGDIKIMEYRKQNVPPFMIEPYSPIHWDLLDQVILSSVPGWETIGSWDTALLSNAFRTSPKIKTLAVELTKDAPTKAEKIDAITRFVMREIRYQQDYENTIAGVKPHAAPVVLQRSYGDCKDKSVLLMTLAKEVGIDTRFALLRTTSAGQFIRELPSLQFNHAIVYIPKQTGIEEPFFVDATPDTLDLKSLRPDSQNTWAMVIEPESGSFEFVRIPLSDAEDQYTIRHIKLQPKVDGMSKAEVSLTFQGPTAGAVRSVLRNEDDARVFTSGLANSMFPSSTVTDQSFAGEDDIVRPLVVQVELESEGAVRRQDDELVIVLPKSENLSKFISLPERKLPLQLGLYLSLVQTEEEVIMPDGYEVKYAPSNVTIDNPFFTFVRSVEKAKDKVALKLKYATKKQLIQPDEYSDFRDAVSEIVESLGQDLILKPKKK